MEISATHEAFAEFIQTGTLHAGQMRLINNIITYLTKNDMIDKKMLLEPPLPISMIRDYWERLMMRSQPR